MNPAEPALRLQNVSMTFPDSNGGLEVLRDISFRVERQEFLCILGPSGSGKTTLLRIIAGLLQPTHGQVLFEGAPEAQHRPRVGLVFQQANLMPWRTALQNITLPLELQGSSPAQSRPAAQDMIAQMGLQGFEDAWPRDLSGGMAQRVAIARSLVQDPDLMLLDEPFGSLDALTRERMGAELLELWQARRKTMIMVTHSISEALLLADRVIVLTPRPGRIALDMPVELPRPRSEDDRYTTQFGQMARALKRAIG
ncbi:MAG TPA: ABC transporter ATP-binding protein [Anaerolineaceae bacterium]